MFSKNLNGKIKCFLVQKKAEEEGKCSKKSLKFQYCMSDISIFISQRKI